MCGNQKIFLIQIHAVCPDHQRGSGDHLADGIGGHILPPGLFTDMLVDSHERVSCIMFAHRSSLPALAVAITFRQFSVSLA